MSSGPVIVGLGDSITAGVGDAVTTKAPYGPGWAAHLAALADASRFTNLARNGARAQTAVVEQLDDALAARADVATLVVGGNDALRTDFSPVDVGRHLSTCVRALRSRGSAVVLATLPPVGLFELCPGRVRRVMRARIDAWYVDRVHPSPLGHRHIAVAAAGMLTPELSPPTPRELSESGAGIPSRESDNSRGALLARLPAPPPPPSAWQRAAWLTIAGVPWAIRRGHDFLPGLVRAVLDDLHGGGSGLADLDLPELSELSDLRTLDPTSPDVLLPGR